MSIRYVHKESSTTLPISFTETLLTPPPSEHESGTSEEHIIEEIERRKSGRGFYRQPWRRYKLSRAAYKRLKEYLQKDGFAQNKLRCDYFTSANVFVLRMLSPLHEELRSRVVDDIVQQLRSIANGVGPAAEFARSLRNSGSATIAFGDSEFENHDPDASFRHLKAQFPGVVIEISYSQKRRDLARLADDYILGSDGNIRLLIAIDIEYREKSATLSMWRPRLQVNDAGQEVLVAHQTLSNEEFRTVNGEANSQTGLRISLEDFAPLELLPKHTKLDKDLFISSTDLCTYLIEAEQINLMVKQRSGHVNPLKPGVIRQRRPSTPSEHLNTDDELQFQEEEERAFTRLQREDSTYRDG